MKILKGPDIMAVKAMGNSATTPRNPIFSEDVSLMLFLLAESVASRMRELASLCTDVDISAKVVGLEWFSRLQRLRRPSCSSAEIAETAFSLFKRTILGTGRCVVWVLGGTDMVNASYVTLLSLFQEDARRDKWEVIDATAD